MTSLYRVIVILFSISLILSACAVITIEEHWHDKNYQPPAQHKILVVALASNEAIRKVFETSMMIELEKNGQLAIPSQRWLSDSSKLNLAALRPILKQNSITTVLVTSIKDVETAQTYQPREQVGPQDNLFRNFDTYMTYSSNGQHETGSYNVLTEYLLETNLFDTSNDKLSWSAVTRVSEIRDLKKTASDVAAKVAQQAGKDGVF